MYNQYKTSKIILYRKKASFNIEQPFLFAYPLFHKHPLGISSFLI